MTPAGDRAAALDPGREPVRPAKLAHVVRRTARFDAMVAWYRTVFAADVVHADDMLAFLTYDDEHHRFAIANVPGLPDRPAFAAGTDHIAFTYADLGALLHTYVRLAHGGIAPYWCINHGPTTSLYYKDPDGNRVELQVDNFPTADECNAWMRSGEFAANPIGVIVDPAELVERYRRGEPLESLARRPALPEGASPFDMLRL
jgi:catechol-2,3-dioxygenase